MSVFIGGLLWGMFLGALIYILIDAQVRRTFEKEKEKTLMQLDSLHTKHGMLINKARELHDTVKIFTDMGMYDEALDTSHAAEELLEQDKSVLVEFERLIDDLKSKK